MRVAAISLVLCALLLLALPVRGEDDAPPAGKPSPPAAPAATDGAKPGEPKPPAEPEVVPPAVPQPGEKLGDPLAGEVPVAAGEGWNGFLVHDNGGVGVWIVGSFQVLPRLACPEIVGLDDRGRFHVITSYSGRWTPLATIHDGTWLGGLVQADVDPRYPGSEIYTGSQRGNLHQVLVSTDGNLESRRVAKVEGRAVNTLIADDFDPKAEGDELLLFTWPGGLYRADPTGPHGTFVLTKLEEVAGRVRDVARLPRFPDRPPEVATVSRGGVLQVLSFVDGKPTWHTVHRAAMGMGRVALGTSPTATVLYTTHDDGRILRHERKGATDWTTETIYLGPQGPRGIATGRFHEDAAVESVAIFGYSGRVEMLWRAPGQPWQVETLYRDADKGHWLARCEVDGRNATDELVASGFGGRIVLLARPPGYGRPELSDPEAK